MEELQILCRGYFVTAEHGEVRRGPLRVVQDEATLMQAVLKAGERHFRRLRLAAEHRLAKKRRADAHAIHSADESAIPPNLRAMGMADPVQLLIGVEDGFIDPRRFTVSTATNHIAKSRVPAQLKGVVLIVTCKPGR